MASTSKPFKVALINASSVSRLSQVLLLKNPCSQMAMLVEITTTHFHNDINKGQLSRGGHKLHSTAVG
jgi:hypothetical protein